jgi:RNA polymerase sigma factor (sigma-70 family)
MEGTAIVRTFQATVGKHLELVFNEGTVTGLSEGRLLERFVRTRDETAFGALVSRHGPMVLGVCRRILRDENDVEDAFQATFLILVRRASAIRRGELVSHWLHGVARRVAVRAKAQAVRRRVHEPSGLENVEISGGQSTDEASRHDLRMIIDQELAALPVALRAPVVLCYLEGMTHDEAARRLSWPVGTVRSRLARARDRLRTRLSRQGFASDRSPLAAIFCREPVSRQLFDSTMESSLGFATKQASTAGTTVSAAATLAKGVLHAMMVSKIKILATWIVAAILALGGAQTLARQLRTGGDAEPAKKAAPRPLGREDAMVESLKEVEKTLADMGRVHEDLRRELESLAGQILALRAARSERSSAEPAPAPSQHEKNSARASRSLGLTAPIMTGTRGGAASDQNTRSNLDKPRGEIGPGNRENTLTGMLDSRPFHSELGWYVFASSQNGNRVAVFDKRTGKSKLLELPVPEGSSHLVTAITANEMLALNIEARSGALISKIAVYAANAGGSSGRWYPQELREQVDQATPRVHQLSVAYAMGRCIYAFSYPANRWDVLELSPGHEAKLADSGNEFQVEDGSHLYSFDEGSGTWNDLDFDAMLDPKRSREEPAHKD